MVESTDEIKSISVRIAITVDTSSRRARTGPFCSDRVLDYTILKSIAFLSLKEKMTDKSIDVANAYRFGVRRRA